MDPVWAQPPIADMETALLRHAAFPELARAMAHDHELVLVDPSATLDHPAHEDLLLRIRAAGERLNMSIVVLANAARPQFGANGFPVSARSLDTLDDASVAPGFADLRERIGWLLAGSRSTRRRHIVLPLCDASLYAIVIDALAQIPASERPFVHLATWWDWDAMPNRRRFAAPGRIGAAIAQLNSGRTSTFLYAWSRSLAQRLSTAFAVPVAPLEAPPELSLAAEGPVRTDRYTVGFFGAPTRANGFDALSSVIRATNRAMDARGKVRFVVQTRFGTGAGESAAVTELHADVATLPERNVTFVDGFMDRPAYFEALQRVDALVMPLPNGTGERYSVTALHAMACGAMVYAYDTAAFAGTVRNRVVTEPGPEALGERIAEAAAAPDEARIAARVARATYWATLRPSRMFAQLLYGPVILGDAPGR